MLVYTVNDPYAMWRVTICCKADNLSADQGKFGLALERFVSPPEGHTGKSLRPAMKVALETVVPRCNCVG